MLFDPARRKRFAVAALDRMLEGGLPEHSITMLLGPTGCGKTILTGTAISEAPLQQRATARRQKGRKKAG